MFYKKTGLPEEGEVVMCTVTNIQYSSVFVTIDDYSTSGMIHISEIAAGRIRNIRDYVKEGKKVACKVLRVHKEKGHVDLSLRRVTEGQKRNKVNEIKQEQKAESVIENVARQNKMEPQKLYKIVADALLDKYEYLYIAFEDMAKENINFADSITLDKKISQQIIEIINQRFKQKDIEISGVLSLTSYDKNGLDVVKSCLMETEKVHGIRITYLGGGRYKVTQTAPDYKTAENNLKQASEAALVYMKKSNGIAEFKKD